MRPGCYVRFRRRSAEWPYWESAYGIVVGTPKRGYRVRSLDKHKTHVLAASSVHQVSFEEAHGR